MIQVTVEVQRELAHFDFEFNISQLNCVKETFRTDTRSARALAASMLQSNKNVRLGTAAKLATENWAVTLFSTNEPCVKLHRCPCRRSMPELPKPTSCITVLQASYLDHVRMRHCGFWGR